MYMERLFGYFYTLWYKLEHSRSNTFQVMNILKVGRVKVGKSKEVEKVKMCKLAHLLYLRVLVICSIFFMSLVSC